MLASSPELVARCLVRGAHTKRGVFGLRYWAFDRWRVVLTDDRVPCAADGAPLFGGCADGSSSV